MGVLRVAVYSFFDIRPKNPVCIKPCQNQPRTSKWIFCLHFLVGSYDFSFLHPARCCGVVFWQPSMPQQISAFWIQHDTISALIMIIRFLSSYGIFTISALIMMILTTNLNASNILYTKFENNYLTRCFGSSLPPWLSAGLLICSVAKNVCLEMMLQWLCMCIRICNACRCTCHFKK